MTKHIAHGILILMGVTLLLAPVGPACAATVTVGPDGDWPTIQQAINVVSNPPDDEIRIQAGFVYQENLTISLGSDGMLQISGGWDSTFSTWAAEPGQTIIDGNGSRAVDVIVPQGTTFFFLNLTVRNGGGVTRGGGLRIQATSTGDIGIYDVVFLNNTAVCSIGEDAPRGGALSLDLDSSGVEVNGNVFLDNTIQVLEPQSASKAAMGGSIHATLSGSSHLQLADNLIQGSSCLAATNLDHDVRGCALYLSSNDSSTLDVQNNTIINTSTTGFETIRGTAGYVSCSGSTGELERNRWQGASSGLTADSTRRMLQLYGFGDCVLTQRSSLLAGSDDDALSVNGNDAAIWYGVNLTVTGNQGIGVSIVRTGTAQHYLSNSISTANGEEDLVGVATVVQQSNLIGTDPGFANPVNGVYLLEEGSPALDTGTESPPGDLSNLDLTGKDRVQGITVDIGAYEGVGLILKDDFESGETTAWSATT